MLKIPTLTLEKRAGTPIAKGLLMNAKKELKRIAMISGVLAGSIATLGVLGSVWLHTILN